MPRSAVREALEQQQALGNVKLNFFIAKLQFEAVAPGAFNPAPSFQIANNMDFLLEYVNGSVFQPAGTNIPAPDLTVNLTNNSTGWIFSDNPMTWVELVGTAQNPFILPEPKLIPGNSSVKCNLVNRTAATTFALVDISFVGCQVFTFNGFTIDDLPVMGG